jgi:hypothetical protein
VLLFLFFDGELLMRLLATFHIFKATVVLAALAAASPAWGATFNDATAENFDGNAHMDISSVQVTDDGANITFKISVSAADITMPNWGKYVVGIDTNSATGDTGSPIGNPWGRNISMADGMDAWVGSWVDSGGGFQPWMYAGGAWTQNGTGTVALSGNMTTIITSLASLGLAPGQSFQFDVYTTGGGGGDSANDALANSMQTVNDWQVPYRTPAGGGLRYTTVPEPSTLVAICGGLIAGLGCMRRRN